MTFLIVFCCFIFVVACVQTYLSIRQIEKEFKPEAARLAAIGELYELCKIHKVYTPLIRLDMTTEEAEEFKRNFYDDVWIWQNNSSRVAARTVAEWKI